MLSLLLEPIFKHCLVATQLLVQQVKEKTKQMAVVLNGLLIPLLHAWTDNNKKSCKNLHSPLYDLTSAHHSKTDHNQWHASMVYQTTSDLFTGNENDIVAFQAL
ncbi:hypothetical protein ABZP36_006025 [Zizania latifolia]